jgi:hypothetical protein
MVLDEKLLFKIGSKIDICGASGSGKTYWLANYLMKVDNRFDRIVWLTNELSAEQQLIKDMQKEFGKDLEVIIGIEDEEGIKEKFMQYNDEKKKVACIFDDLMMSQNKWMSEMFLCGRHLNLTIFQLVQSCFVGGKQSRNMSNNVQYTLLFQFPDALSVVEKARRLTTNKRDRDMVVEAWKQCTSKRGGCLIIDTITSQSGLTDSNLLKYRDTDMSTVFPQLANV